MTAPPAEPPGRTGNHPGERPDKRPEAKRGADGRPWPSLREAFAVWAKVALLSFGGPAGQIAVMHRILVEEKRWLGEARFLHALNFCMLLPGPEAQQLATYTGWLMHGIRGGFIAGLLFVLPGAVAIMALSIVYALYGNVGAVAALFFGLKAAVLAIVVQAVVRIGSRALRNRAMQAIAAISFIAIFFFAAPFPLIVLAAAVLGFIGAQSGSEMFAGGRHGDAAEAEAGSATILGNAPPAGGRPNRRRLFLTAALLLVLWLGPVAVLWAALGTGHVFAEIAIFFSKMAVVTFGGAYAVLAWVAQAGVETNGWLQPGEMLDGLGMAETTPGPLIMVTQFVGFMAAFREPGLLAALPAGVLGGALTTWVTFAPCFLWIFLGAPFVERLRENRALAAALAAITAAVVGVIMNLALWFALHTIFGAVGRFEGGGLSVALPQPESLNPWALGLAAAALIAAFGFRIGAVPLLTAAAAVGLALGAAGAV
ncbi:MAG: chromate efflux transporter [Rhodospirillaceae bacterium]|nr:chromate efflux transporter [Rhodospirillaceae bacterium]MYH37908.1 chromate efflux transporter [Rhodospirillaceae bacterium]MYK15434.1 chromate efflux transporter [Rhodospirillaceae bacterium]